MEEKKNKNEELQSRREFFKDAARKSLPVIGVIALASSPIIAQAAEVNPMGCSQSTCYGGCKNACKGCSTTCEGSCKHACKGCETTCTGGCKNYSR